MFLLNNFPILFFLLLLLLLFEIRNRIVPTGSTPEGGPTEVSPTTQATRHPRALLLFMFPIPPYLLSCILHPVSPLPRPPVLYRYPTKYLVCPLPVFLSYKTPHIWTPQKPTYKLRYLLISTALSKV